MTVGVTRSIFVDLGTQSRTGGANVSNILEGIPESDFADGDVEAMPVAFAYHAEDPSGISEENAKIAALDHDVQQRRRKRNAADAGTASGNNGQGKEKVRKRKSGGSFRRLGERDMPFPPPSRRSGCRRDGRCGRCPGAAGRVRRRTNSSTLPSSSLSFAAGPRR